MLTPKPINRNAINDHVLADMQKMIGSHPNSFECLLFKAQLDDHEIINHEEEIVGTLEQRESTFSYTSPILIKALELPYEMTGLMLASGDESDIEEASRQLLLSESIVPEQSVIWIDELIGESVRTTLLYVLSANPIGKNGKAGFRYNVLPFELDPSALTDDPNDELPPKQPTDIESQPKLGDIESVFGGFIVT